MPDSIVVRAVSLFCAQALGSDRASRNLEGCWGVRAVMLPALHHQAMRDLFVDRGFR